MRFKWLYILLGIIGVSIGVALVVQLILTNNQKKVSLNITVTNNDQATVQIFEISSLNPLQLGEKVAEGKSNDMLKNLEKKEYYLYIFSEKPGYCVYGEIIYLTSVEDIVNKEIILESGSQCLEL